MSNPMKAADAVDLKAAALEKMPNPDDQLPPLSALEEDILTVLLGRTLYGLQISKAIDEASGGQQTLKVGSLYPSLHRLENKGLVSSYMGSAEPDSRGGNRRKYYQITGKGADALRLRQKTRQNLAHWRPAPA